jgi:hypothetical protein
MMRYPEACEIHRLYSEPCPLCYEIEQRELKEMAGKFRLSKDGKWIPLSPHFTEDNIDRKIESGNPPAGKVVNPADGSKSYDFRK